MRLDRPLSKAAKLASGVLVTIVACASTAGEEPPTRSSTAPTTVDCVAVLGTQPPFAEAPLESVPTSGVPRDKLISALDDGELGRFCDYLQCIVANGYNRTCFSKGTGISRRPRPCSRTSGGRAIQPGRTILSYS